MSSNMQEGERIDFPIKTENQTHNNNQSSTIRLILDWCIYFLLIFSICKKVLTFNNQYIKHGTVIPQKHTK